MNKIKAAIMVGLTTLLVVVGGANAAYAGCWGCRVTEWNWDGRAEQFWVGPNGDILHHWEKTPGSGFNSGVDSLAGHITTGVGVINNQDGRLEIFGRADGGDLNHRYQLTPGGGWSNWASLGGQLIPYTGVYADLFSNKIRVKVTGTDGLPYCRWQSQPNGPWEANWRRC